MTFPGHLVLAQITEVNFSQSRRMKTFGAGIQQ